MDSADCRMAARYYHRLGWWPGVFGTLVWTVGGDPIEALDMPEWLGRRTLKLAWSRDITGPVFAVLGRSNPRWVFLAGRRAAGWHTYAPRLTALGVEHLWAGVRLDLPPSRIPEPGMSDVITTPRDSGVPAALLTWLIPPVSATVPTFASVVDTVMDAASA